MQYLLLINASESVSDVIGSCLCCSAHTVMKLTLPRDMGQLKSKIRVLAFRKAKLQLFRVIRTPWEIRTRE